MQAHDTSAHAVHLLSSHSLVQKAHRLEASRLHACAFEKKPSHLSDERLEMSDVRS